MLVTIRRKIYKLGICCLFHLNNASPLSLLEQTVSDLSPSIKGTIMFAMFTSIAMVIGILTIYFTSTKPPSMLSLCYVFYIEGNEKNNKIDLFKLIWVFGKNIMLDEITFILDSVTD